MTRSRISQGPFVGTLFHFRHALHEDRPRDALLQDRAIPAYGCDDFLKALRHERRTLDALPLLSEHALGDLRAVPFLPRARLLKILVDLPLDDRGRDSLFERPGR